MTTQAGRRPSAVTILAGARGALGAVALCAPRFGARLFRIDADGTPAIVMGRLFGVRNAALAAGLLRLEATTGPRSFVLVNVLIDLVDASAVVAAGRRREVGTTATVLGTALALTGASLGAASFVSMAATAATVNHQGGQR
jgi:hypothetical protein